MKTTDLLWAVFLKAEYTYPAVYISRHQGLLKKICVRAEIMILGTSNQHLYIIILLQNVYKTMTFILCEHKQ